MKIPVRFDGASEDFGLVGRSPKIERVLRIISKIKDDDAPVLITGESGVGKEVVAGAIHRASRWASKPFVAVDCSSIGGPLMESELFGYVRGAFTGAEENRDGLVRAASGGILFLDEIGEMSPEAQAKLLRLLQEREIRPIGAVKPVKVSVRVLAATNRDLAAEVKRGRFRKDLFYRLNVLPIHLPPLRERREDILILARHFIEMHSTHPITLTDEVSQVLTEYDWPGNVRELENVVRGFVTLKSDPLIRLGHLSDQLREFAGQREGRHAVDEPILPLAEVERRYILRVVDATKGDITAAAHMLGIGRTTLYRKLKDYRSGAVADEDEPEADDDRRPGQIPRLA